MPTVEFLTIWKSMTGQNNAWKKFVIICFDTFQESNNGFSAAYKAYDGTEKIMDIKSGSKISDDDKYNFLSEKAYAKCMNLRKKMVDANPDAESISPPDGYKSRAGKKKSNRVSVDDMLKLMLG